jgi:hypothetical protein
MKKRIITINLELLEPIKHEEIIINIIETREFNGYEITKIHNNNIGEMTNRKLLGRKIKKGDLIGFKECICISSYQIGQLLMFEKIKPYRYNFTGLSKLEKKEKCDFMYMVTNPSQEIIEIVNSPIFVPRKFYVKDNTIDKKTIETFKDMFEEL